VKTERAKKYRFVIGFVGMVMIFWGCTNDINDLGKDLLLPGDLIKVRKFSEKNIKAYTINDGNQRTDEPDYNLLGTFNDPIFGKTTADFACQFRLSGYPDSLKDVSKKPVIDSLVLSFVYKEVYGDTVTPQRLKVYELGSDLYEASKYDQNIDLKSMSKGELLAEKNFIPRYKLFFDSLATTPTPGSTKETPKDLKIQEIRIKLDQKLITKLMAFDGWNSESPNDLFIKYFKGLYIEAGDLTQRGSIMKINTLGNGSNMSIHFHTKTDTLTYAYNINTSSARVSRFAHDYSKTAFAANLDKMDAQDSLIYLQPTGGLRTKILIPNLGTWKDSTDFAINKAELIFALDPVLCDTTKYPPAEQLVLSAIGVDKNGDEIKYLPSDLAFSQTYYGGVYNHKDRTYRFNIANHLQEVIEGKKGKENYGFYLATSQPSSTFSRVVLKGVTSKTGIKLEITYSKIR
jgi:hypothetical protein